MKKPCRFAQMTAEELNSWYETTVGYRPQQDDPSMTDEELRALCMCTDAGETEED